MKNQKNNTKVSTYTCKYSNGAKFRVAYYKDPDPRYPYEDRLELTWKTDTRDNIGVRMTFAEALMIVQYLTMAMNEFMEDKLKPGFDIPMEAR